LYTMTFSGPIGVRDQVRQGLVGAGCRPLLEEATNLRGLPSYTDPLTAHEAGAPNSGHTPGTLHPSTLRHMVVDASGAPVRRAVGVNDIGETEYETVYEDREHVCEHVGKPYEADPRIGALTVVGEDIERPAYVVATFGWRLRSHGVEHEMAPVTGAGFPEVSSVRMSDLEQRVDEQARQIGALTTLLRGGQA
jgi:hypothetical protein